MFGDDGNIAWTLIPETKDRCAFHRFAENGRPDMLCIRWSAMTADLWLVAREADVYAPACVRSAKSFAADGEAIGNDL